jgi:uncharacterized protein YbjT (DUF2867 family)
MITVMGATGHTGRKIAVPLQQTGEKIRALGRNESKPTPTRFEDFAGELARAYQEA